MANAPLARAKASPATARSEKLVELRHCLGLTQAELAKRLGVSFVSINRWEKGHSEPSRSSWMRIEELAVGSKTIASGQTMGLAPGLDFAADPELVRTLVEGERLSYGHLFNAGFAAEISAIDPLPHQRIAVYDHMLAQPRLRFLLADDAGAGKTVMAGLYLREMLNRRRLRRVLIVAPAGLTTNWQRELANLFGLRFAIATGADARIGNPFVGPGSDQVIVSLDTLAAERMFSRLQEPAVEPYHLVIFDEAHKLSARIEIDGTIRRTDRYRLAEALAGVVADEPSGIDAIDAGRWAIPWRPEHLLLLTATPHMGKDEPYFFLWRLLCPDAVPTLSAFQAFGQASRQPHFLRRTKEEMLHFDGRRLYPERISDSFGFALTQSASPGAASEQLLYDQTTDYLRNFYNRAQIFNQTAARLATGVFQRRLASSTFALLRSLERRSEKLADLIRQVKSDGARPLAQLRMQWGELRDLLEDATADEEQADADAGSEGEESERAEARILDTVVPATLADLELESAEVEKLVGIARDVIAAGHESKFDKLREVLLHPGFRGEKLLVFTEHRDTQTFLVRRLEALGFAGRIAQIHGRLNASQRDVQIEHFRAADGARFMVATDAGGEGINLQFCWLMINYDIPWNPARLEQRMGRIHRYGQEHDPVRIANLVATTTREGKVLRILLDKLEKIRVELRSDKVFDVVGRLLDGASLVAYMEAALRSDAGAAEAGDRLDTLLTRERAEDILASDRRRFGAADGDVGKRLPAERAKLEREELTRLLPGYLRAFLERAAPRLDLGFAGDLGGLFGLRAQRPGALAPLESAFEQYPPELHDRLTLYRPGRSNDGRGPQRGDAARPAFDGRGPQRVLGCDARTAARPAWAGAGSGSPEPQTGAAPHTDAVIFLRPGEAIFEALRQLLVARFGSEARRGAIFIDPQAERPYLIHLARITVERAAAPVVESSGESAGTPAGKMAAGMETAVSRLIAIRQDEDGQLELSAVEALLLLRGAGRPTAGALGLIARAPELASAARAFAEEQAAADAARERQAACAGMPERERELAIGFEHVAADLAARRAGLTKLLAASAVSERPLRQAELEAVKRRQRSLESRRAAAVAAVHAQPHRMLPGPVEMLTHALVLPSSDPEDQRRYDAQVERIAVELACAYEHALGAVVRDVSKPGLSLACGLGENPGFDLWSQRPDGRTLSIEVKGRAGVGDVELTPNEWRQASNRGADHWLYVVYDCSSAAPRLWRVQDPFGNLLAQGAGVFIQEREIFRHAEAEPAGPEPGGRPRR